MAYVQRPYKHTITSVTESGSVRFVTLGTYASCGSAVLAAKKANATRPDETREIRLRNRTYRNRYAYGPVATWAEAD